MIYFRDAKGGLGERAAIVARANMPPGTLFFFSFHNMYEVINYMVYDLISFAAEWWNIFGHECPTLRSH